MLACDVCVCVHVWCVCVPTPKGINNPVMVWLVKVAVKWLSHKIFIIKYDST